MGQTDKENDNRGEIEYAQDILIYNDDIKFELKLIDQFKEIAMTPADHYRYRLSIKSIKIDLGDIRMAIRKLSRDWRRQENLENGVDWKGFIDDTNDMLHRYSTYEDAVILNAARERLPSIVEAVHRQIALLESPAEVDAGNIPSSAPQKQP